MQLVVQHSHASSCCRLAWSQHKPATPPGNPSETPRPMLAPNASTKRPKASPTSPTAKARTLGKVSSGSIRNSTSPSQPDATPSPAGTALFRAASTPSRAEPVSPRPFAQPGLQYPFSSFGQTAYEASSSVGFAEPNTSRHGSDTLVPFTKLGQPSVLDTADTPPEYQLRQKVRLAHLVQGSVSLLCCWQVCSIASPDGLLQLQVSFCLVVQLWDEHGQESALLPKQALLRCLRGTCTCQGHLLSCNI